jgi:hypothetical protein
MTDVVHFPAATNRPPLLSEDDIAFLAPAYVCAIAKAHDDDRYRRFAMAFLNRLTLVIAEQQHATGHEVRAVGRVVEVIVAPLEIAGLGIDCLSGDEISFLRAAQGWLDCSTLDDD